MQARFASGYPIFESMPSGMQSEFRAFIISEVKDRLLDARTSPEGTPNNSVGLMFSTEPEGSVMLMPIMIGINGTSDLESAIGDIIDQVTPDDSQMLGGLNALLGERRLWPLIGVYSVDGVVDLPFLVSGDDRRGFRVEFVYADDGVTQFISTADGVMLSVSSTVPVGDPDDGQITSTLTSRAPVQLGRLFTTLTKERAT